VKINVEDGWYCGLGDIVGFAWLCEGIKAQGEHAACFASVPWRVEVLNFFGIEVLENRVGCVVPLIGYETAIKEKSPMNYLEWIAWQCGVKAEPVRPMFNAEPMPREMGRKWSTDVLVFPHGIWKPRVWPVPYYVELCALMKKAGIKFKVVLKERDYDFSEFHCKDEKSLSEVAAAVQMSQLVIGNDSGPAHLAGTLKVKTLAIHGPTTDRIYSHIPEVESFIKKSIGCSGCHCLPPFRTSCSLGCHELYRTYPEDVFARVIEILDEKQVVREIPEPQPEQNLVAA
jgi:hypothetical protein